MARRVAAALSLTLIAAAPDLGWRVALRSYGPIAFGMSYSNACETLGAEACVTPPAGQESCWLWRPFGESAPVTLLVAKGRVARVDVLGGGVMTRSSVGLGSSEADVQRVYGDRIRVTPHKYTFETGGHYLTFEPRDAADSSFLLIFETDGKQVTRFRAGLKPEVEYVEECL